VNANDAILTELTIAQTGGGVGDSAPNAPAALPRLADHHRRECGRALRAGRRPLVTEYAVDAEGLPDEQATRPEQELLGLARLAIDAGAWGPALCAVTGRLPICLISTVRAGAIGLAAPRPGRTAGDIRVSMICCAVDMSLRATPCRDQRLTLNRHCCARYQGGAGRALDEYSEPLSRRKPGEPFLDLEASCLLPMKPSLAPVPPITCLFREPVLTIPAGRRTPAGVLSC